MNTADIQRHDTAILSHEGEMTSFAYGNENIRFRTSAALQRYTAVKEWDNGYLVVMARYKGMGEVEDYIDLEPILENLYVAPADFLKNIKKVVISYDRQ